LAVKDILRVMEQYSIDEAFFTIEGDDIQVLEDRCRTITKQLEHAVGIPVSIGVSSTKTQAKYANRLAKKAGLPIILDNNWWQDKAGTVLLQDIWGVGGQLLRRYRDASLNTVFDLYQCPRPRLDSLFGIAGLRLQAELSGQIMHSVSVKKTLPKSVTSTRSFKESVSDILVLKDAVARHVSETVLELREQGLMASTLQVIMQTSRYGDYVLRGGVVETNLLLPTADTAIIIKESIRLVERLYEVGIPYKKAGVVLSNLFPLEVVQPSLFPTLIPSKDNKLMDTIDTLNTRFGREKIQLGRHSLTNLWQSRVDNLSPSYTTRWSDLVIAHAY